MAHMVSSHQKHLRRFVPGSPSASRAQRNVGKSRDSVHTAAITRRDVLGGTVAVTAGAGTFANGEQAIAATLELADVTPTVTPPAPLRDAERAIIDVFDASTRSVVNIFDLSLQGRNVQAQVVDVPEGNGSGFVWSTEGHIVTNYHVLANILTSVGPNAIKRKDLKVARVTLLDPQGAKRDYLASVTGLLRSKDLAVLKIEAPSSILQPAQIGTSADVRVGQQVLAIGNPFGFDHTLTTGAVSGLDRVIQSQVGSTISGGIQTDAAINPGNSGGPLLDSRGRVIGVNTAIFTNTGTSAGVGFAIPIDSVARVVPQLIRDGQVTTPTLGVAFASPAIAASLKVSDGALIQTVEPKGPASQAGLVGTRRSLGGVVAGDVITAMNGRRIQSAADVDACLDNFAIGDTISVKLKRAGNGGTEDVTTDVVLAGAQG